LRITLKIVVLSVAFARPGTILSVVREITLVKRCMNTYKFKINSGWDKVRVMVFSATFNNISAISWHSVSLVEET